MERADIISSGLLELYAAGLTSPEESREVEGWVALYPEVAAELTAISEGIEAYAQSQAITPSPQVKEAILSRIGAKATAPVVPLQRVETPVQRSGVPAFWRMLAAACVLLLVGSVIFSMITYNNYKKMDAALARTQASLDTVAERNRLMQQDLTIVRNKNAVPVSLNGLEAAPNAAARIFWIRNTGEVFIDPANLPATPPGKQYQLWGFVDGKPVDGGMIMTAEDGSQYGIQKMKSFGRVEAFAISLEPVNGNTQPKGPIMVMGKM